MKCALPSPSVRIFVRVIHALAKLGDYIYFEAEKEQLVIKTVNSSRSVFVVFKLSKQFFISYEQKTIALPQICKLSSKSLLTVFRSTSLIDKSVETCLITMPSDMSELAIQLRCRFGVVRSYNLNIVECDVVDVPYSRNILPFHIGASSKTFSEAVLNFRNTIDEVTLVLEPTKIAIKNYVDDIQDPRKAIHTELSLSKDEFTDYTCKQSVDLTFNLKDFRVLLQFTELANYSIDLRFETSGDPIVASVDYEPLFTADFVLATLDVTNVTQPTPPPIRDALNASNINISSAKTPRAQRKRYPTSITNSEDYPMENGHESPSQSVIVKKMRRIFKRCFETSFSQRVQSNEHILALDSDED